MKRKKPSPTSKKSAQKIVSIPSDVVLSPQSEVPRHTLGQDRSRKKTKVQELTWAKFDRWVHDLAVEIKQTYTPTAVVGVAHGGVFVGGALATALRADFFPVRISRRSRDKVVRKDPKVTGELPRELKGQRVLIVDDVASSGDTLELASDLAKKVGAKEIKTATLVCKQEGYAPEWAAVSSDDLFVFPWDYDAVVEDQRFDVDPDKAGA